MYLATAASPGIFCTMRQPQKLPRQAHAASNYFTLNRKNLIRKERNVEESVQIPVKLGPDLYQLMAKDSSLPHSLFQGMTLLFVLGCIFFPLSFALLCWGLQNHSNLQMERPEAVLVASK
ncbi:hypothetical protein E2I00_008090 [Balaenoptera physalus]|uniref:Uncharacterized protein n=1 Tax=Balaenoptera physalus TaxID=9770 RepID=A0A643C4X8_BALPH|nr:hypothetical protein E2I00_008090 [Balaenoptera physalus]